MSTSCLSSQQTMAISAHKMDMFKEPMLITKYFYLQSWTNFGIYIFFLGLQVQINDGTHVTVSIMAKRCKYGKKISSYHQIAKALS